MYQLYRKRNSEYQAKDYAVCLTLLFAFVHISIVMIFFIHVLNVPTLDTGLSYSQRKIVFIPILFIMSIPFYRYLAKNHNHIMENYIGRNMVTWLNGLIVISMFIVPIAVMILLQKYVF